MPRFAANLTMMFTEVPFPSRFAAAAHAGFTAVEFLFPYEHAPESIAGWLAESGLENVLFNMPPGNWAAGERGIGCLPGREAEFRAGVERAMAYAEALGTPRLHALAGLLPDGADRGRCRSIFIENLRHAARRLADRGLTLLIEPINSRDMPGYMLNRQADGHAICAEVGEPNLKVQMDFYHTQIVEGDLAMTLQTHLQGVGHIQIAGVPHRHEPDEGEVNYPYLFEMIDNLGYDGWIGCEYWPRAGTEDGLAWFNSAKQAKAPKRGGVDLPPT